jgi:hypothetical protein
MFVTVKQHIVVHIALDLQSRMSQPKLTSQDCNMGKGGDGWKEGLIMK